MSLDPSLLGPRIESYWVEYLDQNDQRLGVLDATGEAKMGVLDGSVTMNVDEHIMGGCSLTIKNPAPDFDWIRARFRPWVMVNDKKWPLGVFVPASPEFAYAPDGITATVSCLDKTSILDATQLETTFSVSAGTQVVGLLQSTIASKFAMGDISQLVITPSAKTVSTALTWVAGTSWLQVFNDLLGSIAYNDLWCDGMGRFRAEPWVDPATVVPDKVFAEGETSIHSPTFTVTQDIMAVPNRVTCVTTGDDTTPSLSATVTNEDPSSPYSYQSRGRWIDLFDSDVEAADQATLNTLTHKMLVSSMTPPWYVSVQHAVVPIALRDVVRFTSQGVDRIAWVNEYDITLQSGSLMSAKWLGVSS